MNLAKSAWMIVLSLCLGLEAISQQSETNTVSYFANASGGLGMIYGGLGGNIEVGARHFSVFGAYGYAPQSSDLTITIPASYNYHFGLRYYANIGSPYIYPRIGVGFGWLSNYYNDRIGMSKYDHSVEGMSVQLGVQFYSAEGVVFSFDAGMGSKVLITNPNRHPYFFDFYIRPCIGIGYDIARLFDKERGNKIRNKEISPFG
ncbi:MAG: hypothetical protein Salg2KO_21290 [Salibacteraceae bacterium]